MTSVLLNEIGLENVVGDKFVFINVSFDYILNQYADGLPEESVVIEVLEDTPSTNEVIGELRRLSDDGYTIALDDIVYSDSLDSLIEIADIIKVELAAIKNSDLGSQVKRLREFENGKTLLA